MGHNGLRPGSARGAVRPSKPNLFRARLWSGTAVYSLLDDLTHPVEPPPSAFHSLLTPDD
jgi:hypothetical protein